MAAKITSNADRLAEKDNTYLVLLVTLKKPVPYEDVALVVILKKSVLLGGARLIPMLKNFVLLEGILRTAILGALVLREGLDEELATLIVDPILSVLIPIFYAAFLIIYLVFRSSSCCGSSNVIPRWLTGM